MSGPKQKRAYVYVDTAQTRSPDVTKQVFACRAVAGARGLVIVKTEIDGGRCGPNEAGRDGRARLLEATEAARYWTLASLITDLGHQGDEDGMRYAVDGALDILSQSAWPQAQLAVDEHGRVVGLKTMSMMVGAWQWLWAKLSWCGSLPNVFALSTRSSNAGSMILLTSRALFLKEQRHATERGDA